MWFYYALLSAVFAALTAIFAKIGVANINSNLATGIRTVVILIMIWSIINKTEYHIPCFIRIGNRLILVVLFQSVAGG